MASKYPTLNLKAVLQETGLKADVLRAWERRYGLPAPQRTEGGHRLYSEYDVQTIKWLLLRQSEGLAISRAVSLWQEQMNQGMDPLAGRLMGNSAPSLSSVATPGLANNLDEIRSAWIRAALAYNEGVAEMELNQAFAVYPVEMVCLNVLQRGISDIGRMWHEGRVTVQQEHYISALAQRRLDSLLLAAPPPTRPHTIMVGCPANEWHTFVPMLMSLFMRRRGYNVIYLGPNVPSARFSESLEQIRPTLVVLSAQQLTSAAELSRLSAALVGMNANVAFGGRIFNLQPALRQCISGTFLGETIEMAIDQVERSIVDTRRREYVVSAPSSTHQETLQKFHQYRTAVEAVLTTTVLADGRLDSEMLEQANLFMGDNLQAALALGDLSYLDLEIEWLRALLRTYDLPIELIPYYLQTYANALRATMNGSATLIYQWVESHTSRAWKN